MKSRDDEAKIRVSDAAHWMKGCSSLGRLRYAALLGVGKKKERQFCVVGFKGSREGDSSDGEEGGNAAGLCPTRGDRSL
jgi:hypothetical protein